MSKGGKQGIYICDRPRENLPKVGKIDFEIV